ncbi:MAG: ABC transporter permease [Propionibacteriaceae bacterium]|jgi:putative ABC transport system permease protein|nr:ABC transporter permease [Propionibacteriaceae bacterium]
MLAAIDQGLIYAVLALGVFLTFRILNFADLTVDASFTTGGGTAAVLIVNGVSPYVATCAGLLAGAVAGGITAFLHVVCRIDPLLASILTMLGLYSINLRIMGGPNIPLLNRASVFSQLSQQRLIGTGVSVALLALLALLLKLALDWFLATDFGLAVMATGDNPAMAASFGVNSAFTKLVALMLANGLAGLCGALMAQYSGFADIGGGTGLILVGLASVILGNALLGTRYMFLTTLGVVVGSVAYRLVIFFALKTPFLKAQDMKVISAVIVVIALVVSQSKRVRELVGRLGLHRSRDDLPEPMTVVPNPFSPMASIDSTAFVATTVSGEGGAASRQTATRSSFDSVTLPDEQTHPVLAQAKPEGQSGKEAES